MRLNSIGLLGLALVLLLAAGCNGSGSQGKKEKLSTSNTELLTESKVSKKYPIAFADRPYKKVHPSVEKAWLLVETAYFVVKEKYRKSSGAQRTEVEKEIEKSIFVVNDTVEALFKEAIAAEPENPLNHAAYAVYLKPRKRVVADGGFNNTFNQALEEMDAAIKIWPDEWTFYMDKVWIRTWPHFCDDWVRAGAMEELAIAQQMPLMEDELAKAEQYYPDNALINYYRAMILVHYYDPSKLAEVREKVMREIKAGNRKPDNLFFFPPPLLAYTDNASVPVLHGTETEPKYVDQWLQFGSWDFNAAHGLFEGMLPLLSWPEDKEDITQLMYCAYALGRTKPYDRSFFTWQQRILDHCMKQLPADSAERVKLAQAAAYLAEIYSDQAQKLLTKKLIKDETKLDVGGISFVENGASRRNNLQDHLQGPQAAYLKRFGEIFGIKFPLPEDPKDW